MGGKTLRENLEVVKHKSAILYIEDIVRNEELFTENEDFFIIRKDEHDEQYV